MILVTLGTQDKQFTRLLEYVDDAIKSGAISDKVIVQAGHTKYTSDVMEIFDFIDMEEFNTLLKDCDLLITHGGVGTIMSALKMHKKVIACPRLEKYHEHHNDHQTEIIDSFSKEGRIIKLDENISLKECIKEVNKLKVKDYISNTNNMVEMLMEYINNN